MEPVVDSILLALAYIAAVVALVVAVVAVEAVAVMLIHCSLLALYTRRDCTYYSLCGVLAGWAHNAIRWPPLGRTGRETTLLKSEHACNVAITFP
jgi:hypothetical protein